MTRSAVVPTRVLILACAVMFFFAWQGCAPRKTAGVRSPEKRSSFTELYRVTKYLISTGQLKQAGAQVKKLERQSKTDAEKAMADDAKASLYLARSEIIAAENCASRAINADPSLASAYRVRAVARKERGNLEGAAADFRAVLSLTPNDVGALRGLAGVLTSQHKTVEALDTLERLLRVDTRDAGAQDAWCNLMASLLGYDRFPVEYLSALHDSTLNRGEIAAILVTELNLAEREPGEEAFDLRNREQNDEVFDLRPSRTPASAGHAEQRADSSGRIGSVTKIAGTLADKDSGPAASIFDCTGFWFASLVEKAVSLGLMDLYPDSTFRPLDPVMRGILALELYVFLDRHCAQALASGHREMRGRAGDGRDLEETDRFSNEAFDSGFADVNESSYLWRPATTVTSLGIMRPASNNAFGVDDPVSGEEAKAIAESLAKAMASHGCKTVE